ncbi:MAG: hypothetical protein JO321_12335 [Solirubrobacterales bacterium]|nr:hypothetical protein [Solirubrobacterales bacterium]MBV9536190.1 hypothetical protein [Solirubrobacterales bacterium]
MTLRTPFAAESFPRGFRGTFVNYDCVLLDVVAITIGAHCQLGTRVQLVTATHPLGCGSSRGPRAGNSRDHRA